MKISITLPSIFPDALERALANIHATTRSEYEVIVVSPFRVEAPNVVWIEETERHGCAHAHTVAAQHATGEFITATADDCAYVSGWDVAALVNYEQRVDNSGRILCLGLHFGLLGTVFGIYYANFPFLRTSDALKLQYFDGNYKKSFTDSDLSLKVWSIGGRCEFTKDKLIEITAEDKRKGGEDCPASDLGYFIEKWGGRYGQGFDTSYMRAINVDFDPDLYPEFVDGFSVYNNTPEFVSRLTMHSPPHFIETRNEINIVKFRNLFFNVPQTLGPIDLRKEEDRSRPEIRTYRTLDEARAAASVIDEALALPAFVEEINTTNIVSFRKLFYCIPQDLGPIDLKKEDHRERPEIRTYRTLDEARVSLRSITWRKRIRSILDWLAKA